MTEFDSSVQKQNFGDSVIMYRYTVVISIFSNTIKLLHYYYYSFLMHFTILTSYGLIGILGLPYFFICEAVVESCFCIVMPSSPVSF